jgi:hypothetical protein
MLMAQNLSHENHWTGMMMMMMTMMTMMLQCSNLFEAE